jgi:hypothetical protein
MFMLFSGTSLSPVPTNAAIASQATLYPSFLFPLNPGALTGMIVIPFSKLTFLQTASKSSPMTPTMQV